MSAESKVAAPVGGVDVLAVLDEWIASNNRNRPKGGEKVRMDLELEQARAMVARLLACAGDAERVMQHVKLHDYNRRWLRDEVAGQLEVLRKVVADAQGGAA